MIPKSICANLAAHIIGFFRRANSITYTETAGIVRFFSITGAEIGTEIVAF
jgi:hypothetical protein